MTLQKAIQVLQQLQRQYTGTAHPDIHQAINLATAALTRQQQQRAGRHP